MRIKTHKIYMHNIFTITHTEIIIDLTMQFRNMDPKRASVLIFTMIQSWKAPLFLDIPGHISRCLSVTLVLQNAFIFFAKGRMQRSIQKA